LLGTDTSAPFSYAWNIDSSTANGIHSLHALAYDNAGNQSQFSSNIAVGVNITGGTPIGPAELPMKQCPYPQLTSDLQYGSKDALTNYQVYALQAYLYQFKDVPELLISNMSRSSLVTGYYGYYTRRALTAFQKKYGINPSDGTVNASTRDAIASHCTPPPAVPQVACPLPRLTLDLAYGKYDTTNAYYQVGALQRYLYQLKDTVDLGIGTMSQQSFTVGSFGSRTKAAVQAFQNYYGIGVPNGIVGADMRNAIQNSCTQVVLPKVSCPNPPITSDLQYGLSDRTLGGQVASLQRYLYQYKTIFDWKITQTTPEALATGSYYSITRDLVKRFQVWYGVPITLDEYGKVFTATRAAILANCN
jgi:peptidoglycan hydrolase-like protein with peptidoglycan-binding domain